MVNFTSWHEIRNKQRKETEVINKLLEPPSTPITLSKEGTKEYERIQETIATLLKKMEQGARESQYRTAIANALKAQGYEVSEETPIAYMMEGKKLGRGITDIQARGPNGLIVLELKVSGMKKGFYQLWRYLESLKNPVGFLVYISQSKGLSLNMMIRDDEENAWYCYTGKEIRKMNLEVLTDKES